MAFDFKKAYKEFYLPPNTPEIVDVPTMNFVAVEGEGDPNEEGGAYKKALEVLYAISYTLKMSCKGDHRIQGFFEYVVPPLEGLWWQMGMDGVDYANKKGFHWVACIRLPDFITQEDFAWAVDEAERKKKLDCTPARMITAGEGLCVQMMHIGPYDDEPASIARMKEYAEEMGYEEDFSQGRLHHEIYLTDPRKSPPEKWRTVIRHPIKVRVTKGGR